MEPANVMPMLPHHFPATKAVRQATTLLHQAMDAKAMLPHRAIMRRAFYDHLVLSGGMKGAQRTHAPKQDTPALFGFPVRINDHLPEGVLAWFFNSQGRIISEISLSKDDPSS